MVKKVNEIKITKEAMEIFVKHAFYSGMTYGYGVNHENIHEDENKFWNDFWSKFKNDHVY